MLRAYVFAQYLRVLEVNKFQLFIATHTKIGLKVKVKSFLSPSSLSWRKNNRKPRVEMKSMLRKSCVTYCID